MKIKALRMFSHYHLGTFSKNETREVSEDIGKMFLQMNLAVIDGSQDGQTLAKPGGKSGAKRRAAGADKETPET